MKYADVKPLLKWAREYHRTSGGYTLADSLSVEWTRDYMLPRRLRSALVAFRHQTQKVRVRQAFKYLDSLP